MDPSYPRASFQSSRVLWGYISLTHWHSWAGKSFSSRSSWDDWCKYAAAESRHWHHHHTDPVNERERNRGAQRCSKSFVTYIYFCDSTRFKAVSEAIKALSHSLGLCDVGTTGRMCRTFSGHPRKGSASDHLWCTVYCIVSVWPHMFSICTFLIDAYGRY